MARRTTRSWSEPDTEALLREAGEFRRALVAACSKAPIGSAAYVAAGEAMTAVDRLAEALTGDRTLFHNKPHTAP